jgi:glycogen(starch) synthase
VRIALISFEFPPAVAVGGIGTYAWNAAEMLAKAGHDVEVFAAGRAGPEPAHTLGVRVHRFDAADRAVFRDAIAPAFTSRHRERPFDVLESPEIGAEGATVARAHPEIARVVKLHTPSFLVAEAGWEPPGIGARMRFLLGALRRGRIDWLRKPDYDPEQDAECRWTRQADLVAAPSQAIADLVASRWSLDSGVVGVYPYPYAPAANLLDLPVPTTVKTIGYLGRLEARKGVTEMAQAIPEILAHAPHVKFRFIGPSWPFRGTDMRSWIERRYSRVAHAMEFTGGLPPDRIAAELARCDVLVLPSRWENFPFACWEAMASGRAVIGSTAGGMAEVIEPGVSGFLVPPRSPSSIADSARMLVDRPGMAAALGSGARRRILSLLAPARVLPLQLASYAQAMQRAPRRLAAP